MNFSENGSHDSGSFRKGITWLVILCLHLCAIFGPLWYCGLVNRNRPKKLNAFRVKIGEKKLSSGPKVGMPERTRPRPLQPPAPPVPAPRQPAVPKPRPRPVPKKTVKQPVVPKRRTVPKKTAKQPKVSPRKPVRQPKVAKRTQPKKRDLQREVYQPPESVITNPKVPIGSVNRAQKYAKKHDNRAPGGGADANFERYWKNVNTYIYSRWKQPPNSRLGGRRPETLVELTVEADGRVSSYSIKKHSGVPAMEESVKAFLSTLDILPRPPEGRITFELLLQTK